MPEAMYRRLSSLRQKVRALNMPEAMYCRLSSLLESLRAANSTAD
jgi:hypothetical protein